MRREHHVQWLAPAPLWNKEPPGTPAGNAPAVLRFGSDAFMEDLQGLLKDNPERLQDQVATPWTYQGVLIGGSEKGGPTTDGTIKLFQPVHGHFNLVAASLVCQVPGLPDRAVNPANKESVGFVLRQLVNGKEERAWIVDPNSPSAGSPPPAQNGAGKKGWQPLQAADVAKVADGEEILPLFPVIYADRSRHRRLHVGLIPTASRESCRSKVTLPPPAKDSDPRKAHASEQIITPLRSLGDSSLIVTDQEKEAARFVLLDLAKFLATEIPDFWQAVENNSEPTGPEAFVQLWNSLAGPFPGGGDWLAALRRAYDEKQEKTKIENGTSQWDFPLPWPCPANLETNLNNALGNPPTTSSTVEQVAPKIAAWPEQDVQDLKYVLRCVYSQPHCKLLREPVVSERTAAFVLAPFFDADAPSRPIRISLPADTSIAGLRKFSKNVGIMASNTLRQQVSRVLDAKEALKGKAGAGQTFELGELCSFSLPIITLCAMVVLMIFLMLLNIVFWWVPFLRICLPIPLKSK